MRSDAKHGAAYGHGGRLGYHPLVASRDDTGEIVHSRMRKGSSQRGHVRLFAETVNRMRRLAPDAALRVRADAGFLSWGLIDKLDALDARFVIAVDSNPAVDRAIAAVDDADWTQIGCTDDGEAQVAETTLTSARRPNPKPSRTVRLAVRRTRLVGAQADLFPDWRHHACAADIDARALDAKAADAACRSHARVELATADLKAGGLAHSPSAGFTADAGLGASSYGELRDRMVDLVTERNRIEGEYLAVVGELTALHGAQSVAYELRELTRMNASQARSESRLAHSLATQAMSDTVEALRAGQIHMSHAKVIAREAPKQHRRSEESFLGLCRAYPSDTVARHTLAYESQQVYADLAAESAAKNLDPVDAELALQRHKRKVSLRCGDDGMWDLRGRFDFLAGRRLNLALQAEVRSQRQHGEHRADHASRPGDDSEANTGDMPQPTTAQLTADALAQLVCGTANSRRSGTSLLIIADYDATSDRLANPRLDDGTPLSAQLLAEHAVDANVLPAVFKADWNELALGRTRNASDAQRLVLAARDGGCIGCELTSEHTEGHHIDRYETGGLTEIPNLASLCRPCHKDLHQHGRQIETSPDGRPRLQPPEPTDNALRSPDPGKEPTAAQGP
ncbi:transposase [Candidatus Poriferisodalis sp.]|uniref:transposase n=1 Tax=Candidatus Poriferisodalis sp. TaxID=3101277 RepID=UPI003B0286C5